MIALLDRPRPLIMAHRGAAAHAPENTLAAFGLALEAGVDILETDLWLTADGVLVCHHDRTLDRVTDMSGAIPELALEQVRLACVGRSYCGQFDPQDYPGERIPTLDELLAFVPPDVGLALELKDPALGQDPGAALLVAAIAPRIKTGMVMLLSFHTDLLWAARERAPEVWIGEISEFNSSPTFKGNGIGTTPQAMLSNPDYMSMARAAGLWVCPLDPAPEERLPWYLKLGVDAVLTHDPSKTRRVLACLTGKEATP